MKAALLLAALAVVPFASSAVTTTTVDAADTGYTPPVSVIASGSAVQWRALDNTHITLDTPALGGDPCFVNANQPGVDSEPVTFSITDGVLTATSYGETYTCNSAIVTPAAATLSYHCLLHAATMRGVLIITQ